MTPRPTRHASTPATRDRILDVATRLFLERGYDGTSLNAIAEAVDISAPSLYWHFKSKQDLLFQYLSRSWQDFIDNVEAAVDDSDSYPAQLSAMAYAHVSHGLERLPKALAFTAHYSKAHLHRTLPAKSRRQLGEFASRYETFCLNILTSGAKTGEFDLTEPTLAAKLIINMCESALSWYDPRMSMSVPEVATFYAQSSLRIAGASPKD